MLALLRLGDELRDRMAERIIQWPLRPLLVVRYGSAARGVATAGPDLDVLVVRHDATEPDDPTWQHQLAERADRVYRWTGKRASVIDMSRRETVDGLGDQEPFLAEADRDGWLVAGQALGELSSGCSSIPG